jgi:hypothetical protein
MSINHTNISHSNPFKNFPKQGFLVRRYAIWQPCSLQRFFAERSSTKECTRRLPPHNKAEIISAISEQKCTHITLSCGLCRIKSIYGFTICKLRSKTLQMSALVFFEELIAVFIRHR